MAPGTDDDKMDLGSGNVLAIVNLYVKPELTGDNKIRLKGKLKKMFNTKRSGEPLFKMSEEKLDFKIENNGEKIFTIEPESGGEKIRFKLTGNSKNGKFQYTNNGIIAYKALYSLYNEETNKYDIDNDTCFLSFIPGGNKDEMICSHRKVYRLKNGDSLLYMVVYNIDDAVSGKNGSVDITISVNRHFFLNPTKYYVDKPDKVGSARIYGTGRRTIDIEKAINGKPRHIKAEIMDGQVVSFKWDNILFTNQDILKNWNDIVSILQSIETTGDYMYRPPDIDTYESVSGHQPNLDLLNSPANYTGEKVVITTYKKAISVQSGRNVAIEIPFGDNSLLPFDAHEIITLRNPEEYVALDEIPDMIYSEEPYYPEIALKNNVEGTVLIKSFINKTGSVEKAQVIMCNMPNYGFEESALKAAYECKFSRARKGDSVVSAWVNYYVQFRLED
jgi:TonB family protein